MTTAQNAASEQALQANQQLAQNYYGVATGALGDRQNSINAGLAQGESPLISSAFTAQRAGLTNTMAGNAQTQKQGQLEGSKKALSGGNEFANLTPSDIGSQLANALYGSKFAEGQADIGQKMSLMNMAMGGAGSAGNAGLGAAQNQLGAIRYLPNYNTTYANVLGAAAGAGSVYGAYQNWAAGQQGIPGGGVPISSGANPSIYPFAVGSGT